MSKSTLLAIAAAITAIANDLGINEEPLVPSEPPTGDAPKKRGRPPGTATPPTAKDKEPDEEPTITKQDLMTAIQPLIKDKRADEVKAVIKKHGAADLSGIVDAGKQAAFLADIEALLL